MNKEKMFFADDIVNKKDWQQLVIDKLGDNVYLTIDLDCFDPSVCPGTGTPEPGGLFWYDVIKLLRLLVEQKNIVAFDIVELAPMETNKISEFLTAKLYYKILSYIFNKK